jgi:uncharacterized protein (DUF4415 family)
MKKINGFPEMTEEMKKELARLQKQPERDIDTSEIPEWDEQAFAGATPFSRLYKPRKKQITARIDADVLAWLKSHGKGYQTYMNELLRRDMMEELGKRH